MSVKPRGRKSVRQHLARLKPLVGTVSVRFWVRLATRAPPARASARRPPV